MHTELRANAEFEFHVTGRNPVTSIDYASTLHNTHSAHLFSSRHFVSIPISSPRIHLTAVAEHSLHLFSRSFSVGGGFLGAQSTLFKRCTRT